VLQLKSEHVNGYNVSPFLLYTTRIGMVHFANVGQLCISWNTNPTINEISDFVLHQYVNYI